MSAFEWEKVWHYSEDDLPPLGAFIQLKIGHVDGNDTRIVEGTVVRVQTSTTTSIGIAPEPVEDASPTPRWRITSICHVFYCFLALKNAASSS